jgi:hypothetical protein
VKTLPVLCHYISETAANDPAQLYMMPLPMCDYGLCSLAVLTTKEGQVGVGGHSDRMSVAGHQLTSGAGRASSALPSTTDIGEMREQVCFVPKAEAMPTREHQRRRKMAIVRSIKNWLC